jgi:hypothetical protein
MNHQVVFKSIMISNFSLLSKILNILKKSFSLTKSTFYSSLMIKLYNVLKSLIGLIFFVFSFNHIFFFLKLDRIFDFNSLKNAEMKKWNCNIEDGLLGMKRDCNLKLIRFLDSYRDIRMVKFCFFIFFFYLWKFCK